MPLCDFAGIGRKTRRSPAVGGSEPQPSWRHCREPAIMPATISNLDLAACDLAAVAECHHYAGTRMRPPSLQGGLRIGYVRYPHRMAIAPPIERGRVRVAWSSLPDSMTHIPSSFPTILPT
jgi:hypothetical protein